MYDERVFSDEGGESTLNSELEPLLRMNELDIDSLTVVNWMTNEAASLCTGQWARPATICTVVAAVLLQLGLMWSQFDPPEWEGNSDGGVPCDWGCSDK